ncbi:MAG: SH3 domain-containing protein [Deltaproteobacteria bacterium]|nr:SH3 domain-containing protein [Deltaproteobacteria bacterium]
MRGRKQIEISFIICLAAALLISMPGFAKSRRMAVTVSVANIRSGAGTGFPTLWRVEKFMPVTVIRESKGWYFFTDFEGSRGWIKKDLVGSLDTVITKKKLCNIRTGPGTGFDIAFQAEKGVPFKVLKRKGKWLKVLHSDGDRGWVYESLVW